MTWKEQQERTLRAAVRQAVTAGIGRCAEPPFTFEEAANICVDEAIRHAPEDEQIQIEGYERL